MFNFDGPEGIVHLGGNQFAILEEVERDITIVTIGPGTTSVDKLAGDVLSSRWITLY